MSDGESLNPARDPDLAHDPSGATIPIPERDEKSDAIVQSHEQRLNEAGDSDAGRNSDSVDPQGLETFSSTDRWFFSDAAAVQRLRDEAANLRGTPFMAHSRDCIWLAERLHLASGSVEEFNFPRSDADYSRHVHNDKILNYLRGKYRDPQSSILDPQSATLAERFAELPLPEWKQLSSFRFELVVPAFEDSAIRIPQSSLLPGDLLILMTGKGLWHMPVMLDDRAFIQCAFPDGVTEGDILAPNYRVHLVALFRARYLPEKNLRESAKSADKK